MDFNGRKKTSSSVRVLSEEQDYYWKSDHKWLGGGSTGSWELQGWTGTHGNGLEFAHLWWRRWSARGASPLSQTQELLKLEENPWSWRLGPGCCLTPTRWADRRGENVHDVQQCLVPCTGPPGVKVHDRLHLSDLRQNTSVAHTILEIFREGSENLLPA